MAPPAPGWATGTPAPGYAPGPVGPPDPHALGAALARLGNGARKSTRSAAAVVGAVLETGEQVEAVVGGRREGHPTLVVLTDRAVVIADDREWKPVVDRLTIAPTLQVQGWQDDRTASLTIHVEGRQILIDQIPDRPLAVEMAQRIRYRVGS